jgi:hypothetical protein
MTNFKEALKEIVCSKFANSAGMRKNKCMSVDHTLPCAYQQECGLFISAITELIKRIVPEEETLGRIDKVEGFNSCRAEILKRLD